ncbi:MAG: PEP/pyruvate-binding domain-containing protein [Mariniblastus sp.]|nr:PEP/pyruvate-binding domain-containing protein [Mariniblastus sp.]
MKPLILCLISIILSLPCDALWAQRPDRRNAPQGRRIEPDALDFEMGVGHIPDRETFERLSYQGPEVSRDAYLANLEFVKFVIDKQDPNHHKVYFMNTENHRGHPPWMRMVGINSRERGAITYLPRLLNPSGTAGLYIIDFQPNDSYGFEDIQRIQNLLIQKMPLLEGRVAFHPLPGNLARYQQEKEKYEKAKLAVHLDTDLYRNIAFLPLNNANSFGRLRIMEANDRPSPQDIVIYRTLPNQMPRVAGVITEMRQTPLSHVNLRAVQDQIPNAYIKDASGQAEIRALDGKLVQYQVTPRGYRIQPATRSEVDRHLRNLRPKKSQSPPRNLAIEEIQPLDQIEFKQSDSFGVKTANLATLHRVKLKEGAVPDGFGVPFYFYDQFMQHNDLYPEVDRIGALADNGAEPDVLRRELSGLKNRIEEGDMPNWMMKALAETQQQFPPGSSLRCRSSTNSEDLPGFSGAGLYDSCTHKPDEGHLANSIKQVFASLWNVRAFEERQFFRIDHRQSAMGVLLHPNFEQEQCNGVAVTDDILYETEGNYYVNTQPGEDMVTNPDQDSSAEEMLLGWYDRDGQEIIRESPDAGAGGSLLNDGQIKELREALGRIHYDFEKRYQPGEGEPFAMEIEFKVNRKGQLVIKQARPWVFSSNGEATNGNR